MTSAVKKTTFDEYHKTLLTVLAHIDNAIMQIKNRQKNLSVWKGYKNFTAFLKEIERTAIKKAAAELELGETTVRDRWRVLTLPHPVYSAVETGEITFSKAKLLTPISFDFESDEDAQIASEIIEVIKQGKSNPEIKAVVEERSREVWNKSDITMQNLAKQHGITEDSKV